MKGAVLGIGLALLNSVAGAHEDEMLFPMLAQGMASEAGFASNLNRPRQPAGQTLPLRATRQIKFDTDEGTWLSVDIAPDSKRLVFDMLGDIYTLDAAGGQATAITRGMAFDTQPTYSPDGAWLAFVSDRSGAENVWVMRPDGSELKQISLGGDNSVLVSPAWSADGKAIYVSRFLWSADSYQLWRYDLDGTETLIVPIKSPGQPRDSGKSSLGAVASSDGKYLYFARRDGTSNDHKVDDWSIVRRELDSGTEKTLLPPAMARGRAPGAYFRPALSPDGQLLAYATRYEGQTGLRLRNLETNEDRWLAFPIEHDQIHAQSWQDLVPRYAFTRDGRAVIVSRNGKLEKLPIDGSASTAIPFQATVDVQLGPQTRVAIKQETGPVRARLIQSPEQSPDGKHVAFSSLGHLYVMSLKSGAKPRRLTSGQTPEFHPSWSHDGKQLTFITWTAKQAGQVWVVPATGGEPKPISDVAGYYSHPIFTPDDKSVLVVRSDNQARLHSSMEFGQHVREATLVALPVDGGAVKVIASGTFGGKPHFAANPNLVYVRQAAGLSSVDLTSGEIKPAVNVQGPNWYFAESLAQVDDSRLSPDGKWVLAIIAQQAHVLAAPEPGQVVDLLNPGREHRRITAVGADFIEWADAGKTVTWSVGSTFYRRSLADIKLNFATSPSWTADVPKRGVASFPAVVEVPRDDPRGGLVLRGARVITMRDSEVIEDGDVLIRDGRIAAVGSRGSLKLPAGTVVRDVTGKTILPGFIDVHDHVADIRRDVIAMESWGLRARLAYGVTTAFDPSTLSIDMFAYQDLGDAGVLVGSRVPSTGTAMFSFNRLASVDEARALLTRYRDHYRTRNVKQYLIGNRERRQWLIQAASDLGMMPTTEGSLSLKLDLTQIMDGYAGNEHALPTPLYNDVIQLVARSGTSYDATLQIKNGGPGAQDNFVIRDRPFMDQKYRRLRPDYIAGQQALSREWIEPSTLLYPRIGGDVARIQRAGGVTAIGSHGEIQGAGFHWELEAHVQGGMTPMEALRAGTLGGAQAIGRVAEFGSLEPGKFADLVVLEADPRDDIRRTRNPTLVMKNGRLYDAGSLEELWPTPRRPDAPWFADERPPGH
ncbi:amidohydrolase family protein [Steroidobacter sp.]|uniref:amidohydrolase family protein n=1 Tax=Steroidobacter sp. TaxID=1978227 RepID=UPI001A63BB5A|nr:amidohydrolase family protein [Steroidobacter sp.]MBL8267207.1 PD40 domain-containing protein [Steroidobacter sp.]